MDPVIKQSLIRAEARAHNWSRLRIDLREAHPELDEVWGAVDVLVEAVEDDSEIREKREELDRAESRLADASDQAGSLEDMVKTLSSMDSPSADDFALLVRRIEQLRELLA